MAQKIKDVVIKTGEYQKDGETKGRWQNVGALMRGDDGNEFIILERWFNPAGLPNPDNRNSVILSLFESRAQSGQDRTQSENDRTQGGNGSPRQSDGTKGDDFDDDIPF